MIFLDSFLRMISMILNMSNLALTDLTNGHLVTMEDDDEFGIIKVIYNAFNAICLTVASCLT